MSIEFEDGRYFVGMWFAGDGTKDWMCAIYRDPGDDKWQIRYRFRYYETTDPHDGLDKKNWYFFEGTSTEEQVKRAVDELAKVVALQFGPPHFVELKSNDAKFCMAQLSKQKWAHSRVLSAEEYRKMERSEK